MNESYAATGERTEGTAAPKRTCLAASPLFRKLFQFFTRIPAPFRAPITAQMRKRSSGKAGMATD